VWTLSGNWLAKGLGIVKTIILARILSPQDFGIIGLATLSMNFLSVFSEMGIESSLIQKKNLAQQDMNIAWTMTAARGVVLSLCLFSSAVLIAGYFNHAMLVPVLQVMALCFLLDGLANIGMVYYQKEVDFRQKVKLELYSEIIASIITVLLTLLLKSVWALVIGSVAWRAVHCCISYRMHPFRPKFCWNAKNAAHFLSFGKHIFWISAVTFVVTCGDDAIVGKLLGLELLGYYTMAYSIANLPVTGLAGVIGKVTFPAYAMIQDDRQRLGEIFRRIVQVTLILLLPVSALMAILSDDLIRIVLGEKWLPMSDVLKVLCLLGLFRGLSNVIAPVQLAVNHPEIQSRNKTLALVVFLVLIYPMTSCWGLMGAGWAVALVYLVGFGLNLVMTASIIDKFAQTMVNIFAVPLLATVCLTAVSLFIQLRLSDFPPFQRLMLSALSGTAVFGGAVMIFNRRLINDIRNDLFQ